MSTCITGQGLSTAKFLGKSAPLGHGAAFAELIQKISKAKER